MPSFTNATQPKTIAGHVKKGGANMAANVKIDEGGTEPAFSRLYLDARNRAARRCESSTGPSSARSSASTRAHIPYLSRGKAMPATESTNTSSPSAEPTDLARLPAAGPTNISSPPATTEPPTGLARLPAPLDYEQITLLDKQPVRGRISYTDCMESSCLRFVQAMLCDARSLNERGQPTRVDLDLVRARVPDVAVRDFFQSFPEILPAAEYAPGKRGYKAREAWARLVTHRPFFTYKRSACGVYKNEWLEGDTNGCFQWATEMEPCVHNVISVCRRFLGVDFAHEDAYKPMWNRHCDTNHEALHHDVSADAQPHLAAAMRQLSRPGFMELQARMLSPQTYFGSTYDTHVTFEVNGLGAWKWSLRRKFVRVPAHVLKEVGGDRDEEASKTSRIRTSWHSEISTWP